MSIPLAGVAYPLLLTAAAFATLYGICETVNGNWSQTEMTSGLGTSTTMAALALIASWTMVTVGRVLFASVQRWSPTRRTYHLRPFVLGVLALRIAPRHDGSAPLHPRPAHLAQPTKPEGADP